MKRFFALLMAFLMLFAFASCKDNGSETGTVTEIVTDKQGETVTNEAGEALTEVVTVSKSTEESTAAESTAEATTAATSSAQVSQPSADPSKWTDEEIVAFYKAAAIKSKTEVKSVQKMTLREMVVNDGDGFLGKLVEMITPFLVSALEKNSTEFDGITGGYEKIELSDMTSVKAYQSGEYTVVEMAMKEQVDGAHGNLHSGTVGHSISVVGDLAVVQEELPNFKIDFENADIKLHYKKPKLKVKISKDGVIEKGTWTYEVYITVANLYVAAVRFPISATVESAYGTVDYSITVGGGF